ncbi:MAG TPA: hypothetical protein VN702_16390 [Acetobacteraceae bacterium]|nr:hypothetical protein [Acetobacteraceae bacterium]
MITLAHPWLALLLPAPLLVYLLLPPYEQAEAGIRVPFFTSSFESPGQRQRPAASLPGAPAGA